MDRATKLALERCPESDDVVQEARNHIRRQCFINGYRQAEQDLALTWEDMHLAFKVINTAIDNCEGKTRQEVFQEAARLFNEQREKK